MEEKKKGTCTTALPTVETSGVTSTVPKRGSHVMEGATRAKNATLIIMLIEKTVRGEVKGGRVYVWYGPDIAGP